MDSLTRSLLQVSLGGSAWVLWLLLGLSVASLAIMIEWGWVFWRHPFAEDDFVAQLKPLLGEEGWPRTIHLCQESRALEAQVLQAGLQHVHGGDTVGLPAEELRLADSRLPANK